MRSIKFYFFVVFQFFFAEILYQKKHQKKTLKKREKRTDLYIRVVFVKREKEIIISVSKICGKLIFYIGESIKIICNH